VGAKSDKYRHCKYFNMIKRENLGWVWWCISVIPVFGRLRQKDHEFEISLSFIETLFKKKEKGRKE
jgi:hypothetical protein